MGQSFHWPGLLAVWRVAWNPSLLRPTTVVPDIRAIDFHALSQETGCSKDSDSKRSVAIAFDKDNTLTAPYQNTLHSPFSEAWESCIKAFGGQDAVVIVSNSIGTRDDPGGLGAEAVEKALGVPVLRHTIKKPADPQTLLSHFRNRLQRPDLRGDQLVVVGDRLFTDIVYGNTIGAHTILVRQIISEKGDNQMAAWIRRVEHAWLDAFY